MRSSSSTLTVGREQSGNYLRRRKSQLSEDRTSNDQIIEGTATPTESSGSLALPDVLETRPGLTSEAEYQLLHQEHARLSSKYFEEGLTKREQLELQMVRWAIDRSEATIYAPALIALDKFVELHHALEHEVDRLLVAFKK